MQNNWFEHQSMKMSAIGKFILRCTMQTCCAKIRSRAPHRLWGPLKALLNWIEDRAVLW